MDLLERIRSEANRNNVVDWLNEFVPSQEDWNLQTKRWGTILSHFSKCRNGVNYEGLLTAHRILHVFMTSRFEELEEAAELVTLEAVDIASKILNGFIFNSERHEYWISYLNWDVEKHPQLRYGKQLLEGIPYLRESLKKIMPSYKRLHVANDAIAELESLGSDDPVKSEEFYEHISFSRFASKTTQMLRYRDSIDNFRKHHR